VSSVRLFFWTLLVGAVAALNYAAYGQTSGHSNDIYKLSAFYDGVVFYGVIFGFTLLIAVDRFDLLAWRAPRGGLGLAARVAGTVIVAIYILELAVTQLPVEDPGQEQGLTPTHWESAHAGAFAANVVLFCVVAPVAEETLFRGLGQSLLRERFGSWPAIALVGLAFGAWHGLLYALLVLVPFGWALAYLRERTNSVYPGMVVHALFNAAAIAVSILS
jgi:membrane protease YdiL (CAAX protease family)